MSKHTLGPWAYNAKSGAIYMDDDVQAQVATVNFENCSEETAKADGGLIAAAPDLYYAGRQLAAETGGLRAFEHEIRATIGNTNWSILMDRLVGMDAAITKATEAQP